mgnify:CR=1 FL=1
MPTSASVLALPPFYQDNDGNTFSVGSFCQKREKKTDLDELWLKDERLSNRFQMIVRVSDANFGQSCPTWAVKPSKATNQMLSIVCQSTATMTHYDQHHDMTNTMTHYDQYHYIL